MRRRGRPWSWGDLAALGICGAVVFFVFVSGGLHLLKVAVKYLGKFGKGAAFPMSAIIMLMCLVPLPGFMLVIGACGFMFPLGMACALVACSVTTGSVLALLLYRRVLESWVQKHLESYPRFQALTQAIDDGGIKVVVLFRVAPVPYAVLNMLLSATNVGLLPFVLVTAIDQLRFLLDVYVGYAAREATTLSERAPLNHKLAMGATTVVAIGASVLISWYISYVLQQRGLSIMPDLDWPPDDTAPDEETAPLLAGDAHPPHPTTPRMSPAIAAKVAFRSPVSSAAASPHWSPHATPRQANSPVAFSPHPVTPSLAPHTTALPPQSFAVTARLQHPQTRIQRAENNSHHAATNGDAEPQCLEHMVLHVEAAPPLQEQHVVVDVASTAFRDSLVCSARP